MKYFLFFFFLYLSSLGFSQKIKNLKSSVKDEQLVITYDLIGPEDQKFCITILSSSDGGQTYDKEATTATGDVGNNIESGKKKKIIWEAAKETSMKMENIKYTLKAEAFGLPPKKKKK